MYVLKSLHADVAFVAASCTQTFTSRCTPIKQLFHGVLPPDIYHVSLTVSGLYSPQFNAPLPSPMNALPLPSSTYTEHVFRGVESEANLWDIIASLFLL